MSDFVDEMIREELGKWQGVVLEKLANEIRRRKLTLTEDLLKSLQTEVLREASGASYQLRLAFMEYGRIKEMRSVSWKNMPPVEEMEKFVAKVGVERFKYVPGYKFGQFPTDKNMAIRRIAWGIAISRKRFTETRPRKWFARPFYVQVEALISNITTRFAQQTLQHTTTTLLNGTGTKG